MNAFLLSCIGRSDVLKEHVMFIFPPLVFCTHNLQGNEENGGHVKIVTN